jgi:hypothetical protein
VSAEDWEHAIHVRDEAILGANYAGFLSYAWGKNAMGRAMPSCSASSTRT